MHKNTPFQVKNSLLWEAEPFPGWEGYPFPTSYPSLPIKPSKSAPASPEFVPGLRHCWWTDDEDTRHGLCT